jgi:hypothetical protein
MIASNRADAPELAAVAVWFDFIWIPIAAGLTGAVTVTVLACCSK